MGGYLGSGTSGSEFEAEELSKAMTREREERDEEGQDCRRLNPGVFCLRKIWGRTQISYGWQIFVSANC